MRVLIVDDNKEFIIALRRGLKPNYSVDVALKGSHGITLAESTVYDVILLDLNLPDLSGRDVCHRLRKNGVKSPIIVLSGRDVLRDKVEMLDIGADDYVTKPFNLDEVKARIRAAIRHHSEQPTMPLLSFQELELNPAARTVKRNGIDIELCRKEFDLLEYMIRNHSRILTRPMILSHIWDMNENLWANVVDVHIKHLRDKVDRPFDIHYIKTIHGVGYKLAI